MEHLATGVSEATTTIFKGLDFWKRARQAQAAEAAVGIRANVPWTVILQFPLLLSLCSAVLSAFF